MVVVIWIMFAGANALIADNKNLPVGRWVVYGFIFGIFSTFVLLSKERIEEETTKTQKE